MFISFYNADKKTLRLTNILNKTRDKLLQKNSSKKYYAIKVYYIDRKRLIGYKYGSKKKLKKRAPDTARTCDLRIRSPLLYPTELQAHFPPC